MTDADGRRGVDELVAALAAEPAGRVFLSPPPDPAELDAFERDFQRVLPGDVRELFTRSNGVGLARPSVSFYMPSIMGLRRLNDDDVYTTAFPQMLLIADDGGSGLYVIDTPNRTGHGAGTVLLTDRGSLQPVNTAIAGPSVTDVLWAVLAGENLWRRPRLGR
jgi:hypothetical protein